MNEIDQYIQQFPKETQRALKQVRKTIQQAAPEAEEAIKYAMPAFVLNGNLVFYAAYKNHIGFYATPTGHAAFKKDLSSYKQGKGSVQFPLDQPMPLELIARIVQFRVKENMKKGTKKTTEKIFPLFLAAPAQRALKNNGITTLNQLSKFTEAEILTFHGMGKSSMPLLREALKKNGLGFKK